MYYFDVLESAVTGFFQREGLTRTRAAQAARKALRARRTELYATAHERLDDLVQVERANLSWTRWIDLGSQ